MPKILCTFSGRYGDVLWSLPTVKEISRQAGEPVDMLVMANYRRLLPLLEAQSYIRKAWASEEWQAIYSGSPCGDQPWQAPVPAGMYEAVHQLTYKFHPSLPLMVHTAQAAGISLPANPLPFLDVDIPACITPYISYAFNPDGAEQKAGFIAKLKQEFPNIGFVNAGRYLWLVSAGVIKNSAMFIGCRSANYVLAHGLAKKVLVYEPNPGRWPSTFGCPFGEELMYDPYDVPKFVEAVRQWMPISVEAV